MTHFWAPGTVNGLKWIPVFPRSLKALFLRLFSKCRFTFSLVCGCYFRNVSKGEKQGTPDLSHTRAHSPDALECSNRHACTPSGPWPLPPRAFCVYLWRTSGFLVCCSCSSFNIQYNLLSLHLLLIGGEKSFSFSIRLNFFYPILVVSRTPSLEKKKRSVRGGGWVLDILFKLLEQPNRIVFISFELVSYAWSMHKILHRLADEMLGTVKCQWFPNGIV